jgi:hypothetical protein
MASAMLSLTRGGQRAPALLYRPLRHRQQLSILKEKPVMIGHWGVVLHRGEIEIGQHSVTVKSARRCMNVQFS